MPDSLLSDGSPSSDVAPTDTGINSPGLTKSSNKPKRRAITNVQHIFQIVDTLQSARRSQNEKNGRIQAKLNSERPYDEAQLKSEGLGYKSNFSTKPLSTTVGKVSSRLTKAIQAARYLTSSELPDSIPDAKKKTELFRREITNTVRRWPGWYNFCNEVAAEDATFGWTTAAWLDTYSWKPVHFRQDRAFVPDGTTQSVESVQVAIFTQPLFPHELAEFIVDREAAELAGWDIENTVESINNAKPPSIPAAGASPFTDARRYEDAIRESSVSLSLIGGAKQINVCHVFATEIDGKVSHYIADVNSKKLLFEKLDRYATISDAVAILSYEQAQTLMGSKGIGREVYEIANVVDRSRNEVVDRLQLSGKIIVQAPANRIQGFKLTVVGNVILIPEGFNLQQNKIEAAVAEFDLLDTKLTQLLDQIAGGVTPRRFDGERVTKAEVELFASREEEKRDDITTRFVTQFGTIVSTIQRRICDSGTTDEDAKRTRAKLLQYMTEEELKELAEQPALRTVEDYTQSDAQKVVLIAQESRNDPLYDHKKMERRKLSVLVDPEFADDVLLPDNDPTVEAEQAREQLLENELLGKGIPIPVSPRDAHLVHIEILKQGFQPVAQAAAGGDVNALSSAENWLAHWQAHLEMALQSSADKAELQPLVKELQETAKQIGEIQGEVQAQAAANPAVPALQPPALAAAPSAALAPAPVAPTA